MGGRYPAANRRNLATIRQPAALIWLVFLAGGLCFPHKLAADAWPQPVGTTQIITTTYSTTSDEYYDADGDVHSGRSFTKLFADSYLQHGLSPSWTALAKISYVDEYAEVAGYRFAEKAGFQKAEIGARYYVGTWDATLYSLDARLVFYLGEEAYGPLRSDTGDIDIELGFITGGAFDLFGSVDGFVENRLSGTYRPGGRPYEIATEATIGFKLWQDDMLLLKSAALLTLGEDVTAEGYTALYTADLSYVFSVNEKWGVELGGTTTLSGSNMPRSQGVKLALWTNF